MSNVTPFPFENLPKYSQEEVLLKKKLYGAYHFFANRPNVLKYVADPFVEILGGTVQIKITHVESARFDDIEALFTENTLLGVVRIEPHAKKAGVIFDSTLAKLLIHKVLNREQITQEKITAIHLRPLTALEEAVVQYVLVSLIEKTAANFNQKNFMLSFEDILRKKEQFKGSFSNQEDFAVFSIKLKYLGRDFFLKLVLPVSVAEDLESADRDSEFSNQRIKQFENFTTEFQLEVGHVTLEPEDVNALSPGDIILFDQMFAEKKGTKLSGHAEMRQTSSDSSEGYRVGIETSGDVIEVKIESML